MNRYGFNVKTRSGQRVENIVIMAASRSDAERRLVQMYVQCEILECREQAVAARRAVDTLDVEAVIGLIAQGPQSIQHPGTY
ncbi:MAG: hypothetical protein ABW071_08130 [Casimicrobiaceae bacterium]